MHMYNSVLLSRRVHQMARVLDEIPKRNRVGASDGAGFWWYGQSTNEESGLQRV